MSNETRTKWNLRYSEPCKAGEPARVLVENLHLLPSRGLALDLACGLGANAVALARHGLQVHAWDISDVAIQRLQQWARTEGLHVEARVRDVEQCLPSPQSFDVVVVTHFLHRALTSAIIDALRPGGLLFYQTFTQTRVAAVGPAKLAYQLAEGELLRMFAPLHTLVYREEGLVGELTRGFRNKAMLIARKPL